MNILHRLASGLCLATLCSAFAFSAYSGETVLHKNNHKKGCEVLDSPKFREIDAFCSQLKDEKRKTYKSKEAIEGEDDSGSFTLKPEKLKSLTAICKQFEEKKKELAMCITVPPTDVGEIKDSAYKGIKQFAERIPSVVTPDDSGKSDLPSQPELPIRLGGPQ